jgi:hypothetical protein
VPWAVNVSVVAIGGSVLLVRSSYSDTALALFRSVVYLLEGNLTVSRIVGDVLGQDLGYSGGKGCLTVVHVAYGAHVQVRLISLKSSLGQLQVLSLSYSRGQK